MSTSEALTKGTEEDRHLALARRVLGFDSAFSAGHWWATQYLLLRVHDAPVDGLWRSETECGCLGWFERQRNAAPTVPVLAHVPGCCAVDRDPEYGTWIGDCEAGMPQECGHLWQKIEPLPQGSLRGPNLLRMVEGYAKLPFAPALVGNAMESYYDPELALQATVRRVTAQNGRYFYMREENFALAAEVAPDAWWWGEQSPPAGKRVTAVNGRVQPGLDVVPFLVGTRDGEPVAYLASYLRDDLAWQVPA